MNSEKRKEDIIINANRASIYFFLSGIYAKELTEEQISELKTSGDLLLAFTQAGDDEDTKQIKSGLELMKKYFESVKDGSKRDVRLDLAEDYAGLFLGVRGTIPHPSESAYQGGRKIMTRPYREVQKIYEEAGLSANKSFTEPEDHIATELSFMGFLANKTSEAIKQGNVQSEKLLLQSQKDLSDIVLPARFLGERDDIITWENYAIYMHTVCNPVPDAWNDFDIYTALATKLGFGSQFTGGNTADQWLQTMYAAGSVPLSFSDFKNTGFYKFPDPVQTPTVLRFATFHDDPVKNPLTTKSGLIEVYSDVVATQFGASSPYALAQYVVPTEGYSNPLAVTYPLIMLTPHPKNGRHSQWQNIAWVRTNDQMFRNGYRTMYINTIDANARGIKDGDVVKVFNQRGGIVCTATVTERAMPGTLYIWEGAWYQPMQPGNANSTDLGGDVNLLIDNRIMELTSGMLGNALVDVQKWNGQ